MRPLRYAAPQLPLLLLLLVCCAGGCLASVVTYSCSFDKVRRMHGNGLNEVVVMNLPVKQGDGSTTYSVFEKDDWQPIRIEVSTKDVEDTNKHCVFSGGDKTNLLGDTYRGCTLEDKLTDEKKETLQKVIPAAVKLHTDRLLVQPLKEKLKVPKFTEGSVCSNFSVPDKHRTEGVDADMVIYVAAAPGGVWALPCATRADGRPVVAVMNFAPAELMYVRLATRIAAHLIAHALGFDHRTMVARNMVANVTGAVRGRGLAVVVNSTSTVMNAKEHYDCDKIYGMELQDMDGDGTKLESHWSKRNAKDELMAPIGGGGYYTALTMAAFADLGFFKVNWKMAEPMSWGKDSGCDLLEKRCEEFGHDRYPGMFCNNYDGTLRCTSDRYFNGTCTGFILEMGSRAGTDDCPIVEGFKDKIDDNYVFGSGREKEIRRALEKLREKGQTHRRRPAERTLWCIDADLTLPTSQYDPEEYKKKAAGEIVNVTCTNSRVTLFAKGITDWSPCTEKKTLSFSRRGYASGTVVCPKYEEVCTISANGSSRLPSIPWDGKEKVYNSKYTKGPLPVPQSSGSESDRGSNTAPTAPPRSEADTPPVNRKPQADVDPPAPKAPEVAVPQVNSGTTEERENGSSRNDSGTISERSTETSAAEDIVGNHGEEGPLTEKNTFQSEIEKGHADSHNNFTDAADVTPKDDKNGVTGPNGAASAGPGEEVVVPSGNATTAEAGPVSEGKETPSPSNTTPAAKLNVLNISSFADIIAKNGGGDSTVHGPVSAVLLLLLGFWGVTTLC